MDTPITYTGEELETYPIYPSFLISRAVKTDVGSSLGAVWLPPIFPIGWRFSPSIPLVYRESFIGMLTDVEARGMKERISLFKKCFGDDLARRNKILFRE